MKKLSPFILISALFIAPQSHAEGWLDSLKDMLGFSETAVNTPNVDDMVDSVSEAAGITEQQATGGLASIFNYAQKNLSSEQVSQLGDALPGLGSLLQQVPDVSEMTTSGAFAGLLDKAASYSETLQSVNDLKKQFDALGLDTQQIMQIVDGAKAYLDTEEGQQIKSLLSEGLTKLSV
ncbi:DUF2780 domain-containing protein [Alteromonas sp. 345S023]|uniref:DUF2780 domain-containing protein n=1 Tax=Alteromonas profundi TaxID=2696062 RepID=A0A7X5LL59_9ALTE|nr:DUF2780 domain-containing protein [Alteromonas profundi]NDV91373.1 DUF2780 domain-containing protein [Alteromonas profundi]